MSLGSRFKAALLKTAAQPRVLALLSQGAVVDRLIWLLEGPERLRRLTARLFTRESSDPTPAAAAPVTERAKNRTPTP